MRTQIVVFQEQCARHLETTRFHSDLGIACRQLAGTDRTGAGINKVEDSGPAVPDASARRDRMIAKLFGAAAIGAVLPDAPHSADLKAGALLLPRHATATPGMEN